jgi:putative ABC transport system permease protein
MKTARPLHYEEVAVGLLLIGLALAISRRERLGLERSLLVGAARTFLQLAAVGYVLGWVFAARAWYWTLLMLAVMAAAAVHAAAARQERRLPGLAATMALSIAGGSCLVLAIVIGLAIRPEPWYDPQYVIPLAGMILGNSLTGAALAVERFAAEVRARRLQVEAALSLGATGRQAADSAIRAAVRAALVPTINAMMVVGLVQLPGMMTGQILAGAPPAQAVRYQMVVMYMLTAAAALTSAAAAVLAQRSIFTPNHQLRDLDGPAPPGGR